MRPVYFVMLAAAMLLGGCARHQAPTEAPSPAAPVHTAPVESAVQLTAATNRPASPASTAPGQSSCRPGRKLSRTTRRSNNPHSSPAIRGFAQSGFNEVAPTHAKHLVARPHRSLQIQAP